MNDFQIQDILIQKPNSVICPLMSIFYSTDISKTAKNLKLFVHLLTMYGLFNPDDNSTKIVETVKFLMDFRRNVNLYSLFIFKQFKLFSCRLVIYTKNDSPSGYHVITEYSKNISNKDNNVNYNGKVYDPMIGLIHVNYYYSHYLQDNSVIRRIYINSNRTDFN